MTPFNSTFAAAFLAATLSVNVAAQTQQSAGGPDQRKQPPQQGLQGQQSGQTAPPKIPPPDFQDPLDEGVIYKRAYRDEYPLSDKQTRQYRRDLEATKESASRSAGDRPIPESNRIPIELSTVKPPQVLRVAADMVSTVMFTDATGQPWPIAAVVPATKGWVDIKRNAEKAPHIFTVAPLETYVMTNLSVWLQDSTTPVIIQVVSDKRRVDSLLELMAQSRGPLAKKPTVDFAVSNQAISPEQNDIMSGLTPSGATALKVMGGDARAWVLNNKMYLRSKMMLRAPTARFVFSSSDGTKVYELPVTPVVNMVDEGRSVSLSISGIPAPQIVPVASR